MSRVTNKNVFFRVWSHIILTGRKIEGLQKRLQPDWDITRTNQPASFQKTEYSKRHHMRNIQSNTSILTLWSHDQIAWWEEHGLHRPNTVESTKARATKSSRKRERNIPTQQITKWRRNLLWGKSLTYFNRKKLVCVSGWLAQVIPFVCKFRCVTCLKENWHHTQQCVLLPM